MKSYKHSTISKKMFLQALFLLALTLIITLGLSYAVSYQTFVNSLEEYLRNYVDISSEMIDKNINDLETIIENIASNQNKEYDIGFYESVYNSFSQIEAVLIISNTNSFIIGEKDEYSELVSISNKELVEINNTFKQSWKSSSKNNNPILSIVKIAGEFRLVCYKKIDSYSDTQYVGIILNYRFINDSLTRKNDMLYLSNGNTAYKFVGNKVIEVKSEKKEYFSRSYVREGYIGFYKNDIYAVSSLKQRDYSIILMHSIKDVIRDLNELPTICLTVGLGWMLIILFLSIYYFDEVTKPIKVLKETISSQIQSGFRDEVKISVISNRNEFFSMFRSLKSRAIVYFFVAAIIPSIITVSLIVYRTNQIEKEHLSSQFNNDMLIKIHRIKQTYRSYYETSKYIKQLTVYYFNKKNYIDFKDTESLTKIIETNVLPKLNFGYSIFNIEILNTKKNEVLYSLVNHNKKESTVVFRNDKQMRVGVDLFQNDLIILSSTINDEMHLNLSITMGDIDDIIHTDSIYPGIKWMIFSDENEVYRSFEKNENAYAVALRSYDNNRNDSIIVAEKELLVIESEIDNINKVLVAYPKDIVFYVIMKPLLIRNLFLLIAYILIIRLLSEAFSKSILKSLSHLRKAMDYAEKGYFLKYIVPNSKDEIEELGKDFNLMIKEIQRLIHENQQSVLRENKAEILVMEEQFNAMQSQINPHFLHNTLETIQYMILLEDERAIDMIQLLGDLFRLGIGHGERYVYISQELRHVDLYSKIQQIRYENRFEVTVDISEKIQNYKSIKFILQPIVENAIQYGCVSNSKCNIKIKAKEDDKDIWIKVLDDGIGIEPRNLEKIKKGLTKAKPSKSIGLNNIHNRIQLIFGKEYGIDIKSSIEGTEVILHFPKIS